MKYSILALTLLFVLVTAGTALAQATTTTPPSMTIERTVTAMVTVVGIDRADRELTVQGPQGNIMVVDVDPSVAAFDQVQVGDKISMDFYQSVSVSMSPKGTQPSVSVASAVGRGPGARPEGYNIQTIDAVATVKSINRQTRMVTLQGPSGEQFTVQAPQNMAAFDNLKVGDAVNIRYTEAMAIALRR